MRQPTPLPYSAAWLEHCRDLAASSDRVQGTLYTGVITAMDIVSSFRILSDGAVTVHVYAVIRQGGDDHGPHAYHVTVAQGCLVATHEEVRVEQCECLAGQYGRGCKHVGAWSLALDCEDVAGQETIPLSVSALSASAPVSGR